MRHIRALLLKVAQMMTIEFHVGKLLATRLTKEETILMHARIAMRAQITFVLEVRGAIFAYISITQLFRIDIHAKAG